MIARVLAFIVAVGAAGTAYAQGAAPEPPPAPPVSNSVSDSLVTRLRQAPWIAEGRACEGCPRRSVGKAFSQTTIINVFYELANLARGQVTAKITPKTWWANMQQGWVWDLDDFMVNQLGHPYQGNNYFNAARANGLSFWESAGVTAFGSGTWEYFGETNHASLNDLINTTLGGIALGEMFHRTAWLVRDTHKTGGGRLASEIAATALDPITGVNRFITGDSSRVSDKPAEFVPAQLRGHTALGALWRGTNSRAFANAGEPFLEVDLLYGDPTVGRSRTPYDAFDVSLRFGGGSKFSEARVRGRLIGQPFKQGRLQINVQQAYDFEQNDAYQFGAQSFELHGSTSIKLSESTSMYVVGWGGLTALGAVDSLPPGFVPEPEDGEEPTDGEDPGQGVSEGPRFYDYGPGSTFGGGTSVTRNGREFANFYYRSHHLYSLDGVRANHLLQHLRLDLLVPVHKELGFGASAEFFHRKTYYQDGVSTPTKLHYPQFRAYFTWRVGS